MDRKLTMALAIAAALAAGAVLWGRRGDGGARRFDFDRPAAGSALAAEPSEALTRAKGFSRAFVEAAAAVRPAVVHIAVERKVTVEGFNDPNEFFRRFFGPEFMPRQGPPREQLQQGQGSGVIVDKAGYILTNNHVVGQADRIRVKLADKREFEAKLVGADERSDVAVIKIEAEHLPVAPTGDSDRLEVGEWVLAIGNPFGLDQTVTGGMVSAKGRAAVVDIQYQDFIQTDAAINPGNSGGPLVDLDGRVVGINTAIFSRSGGYMGIGFAIPVNMARKIMRSLVDHGKVVRGWLGVRLQDVDDDMAKVLKLPEPSGAMVVEVVAKSPAQAAGLAERDVIVSLGGRKISGANDLMNQAGFADVGKDIEVEFYRKGRKQTVKVRVAERTADAEASEAGGERLEKLGLVVEEASEALREKLGLRKGERGLVVTEVKPGSPADRAGFQPGVIIEEVDEEPVASVADLKKALGVDKARVLIKVRWRGRQHYLAFRLK
jgi:serine protease Do